VTNWSDAKVYGAVIGAIAALAVASGAPLAARTNVRLTGRGRAAGHPAPARHLGRDRAQHRIHNREIARLRDRGVRLRCEPASRLSEQRSILAACFLLAIAAALVMLKRYFH
jgi:hypothetical protein